MQNPCSTTERQENLTKSVPLPGTRRQHGCPGLHRWHAVVEETRTCGAGRGPLRAGVGTKQWARSASLSAQPPKYWQTNIAVNTRGAGPWNLGAGVCVEGFMHNRGCCYEHLFFSSLCLHLFPVLATRSGWQDRVLFSKRQWVIASNNINLLVSTLGKQLKSTSVFNVIKSSA